MEPCFLTAAEAAALIADRRLSVEELARSCLSRIAQRDAVIHAWLHLDPDQVIRRARSLDGQHPKTAVSGLPVGIKDVMDTADMPTTHNSLIYKGARVGRDAACVAVMRYSGALIMGKTDTVEFAAGGRLARTTNPHNTLHTPGGSSSGSAAAVADSMVPLALGTQTAGSVIRPASFTGVYGMKPTHGAVSREGVRMSSHSLDTVGWFGRSVADLALVAGVFRLSDAPADESIDLMGLRVGLCRTAAWPRAEPVMRMTVEAAAAQLEAAGACVVERELPVDFDGLIEAQQIIENWEGGAAFLPEYLGAHDLLAPDLQRKVDGRAVLAPLRVMKSYALAERCRLQFDALFHEAFDVILTPASCGEAPEGLQSTGDPVFNRIWSLLHAPCICIPIARGPRGLPLGAQIVVPRFLDARLLSIARAMEPVIGLGSL